MDLQKITRLFLPMTMKEVLSVKNYSNSRVVEMLHELDFMTRSISQAENETIIELQILDPDKVFRLFAGEAHRFFLASMITNSRANQKQSGNAAWQAIEHYYAAYYAAHYLIRLTGVSLSNIDKRATQAILKATFGGAPVSNIPTGLYVLRYDANNNLLILRKKPRGVGGSHQEAWQLWEELVKKIQFEANKDPVEYASVALDINTHMKFLVRSTGHYNPPEVRGSINYQFKGSVWEFEEKVSEKIRGIQSQIADSSLRSPIKDASPDGLIANNKILILLAKSIFNHNAERYPKSICRSLSHQFSHHM